MACIDDDTRFAAQVDRARTFVEPQMEALGLSTSAINHQSLDELHQSLDRINEALAHPESFGTLKLRASAGTLIVATTEAHIEVGVMPVLLERNKLVLERIAELRGEQKIDNLRDLVTQVDDADLKRVLEKEVTELESTTKYQDQAAEVERQQAAVLRQFEIEERTAMLEKFERKSQVWRAFLERRVGRHDHRRRAAARPRDHAHDRDVQPVSSSYEAKLRASRTCRCRETRVSLADSPTTR